MTQESSPATPKPDQSAEYALNRKLQNTTDASVWTDEFMKLAEAGMAIDWGTMVGWFANAIEVGREAGHQAGPMRKLAEHLQYLAEKLVKAATALPDGEPWVNVSAVAMELTRLSRQFSAAARNDGSPS